MRYVITLFCWLLLATPCFAEWNPYVIGIPGGIALNTVDMSRGFEADSDPTGWAETDTGSLLNRYDSAQAHSGTYSMSIVGSTVTAAYQRYDIGSNKTDVSISQWFYAPSSSAGDDVITIGNMGQSIGTTTARIYWRKSAGAYNFGIRGTAFVWDTTSITAGAWYRLELDITQNATSILTIYNTSGTQVATVSCTANNNAVRYLHFGKVDPTGTTGWGGLYFDDIGSDWTDATTPLWQYSVSN